ASAEASAQNVQETATLDQGMEAAELGQFGKGIATNGAFVFVSTSRSSKVHVFQRDVNDPTRWDELGALSGTNASNGFGTAIDVDADTLAVNDSVRGTYLFERDPNAALGWTQSRLIAYQHFGAFQSVAIEGDVLVVGEPSWRDDNLVARSSVHVYERDTGGPGQWGLSETLDAPKQEGGEWFGAQVAIAGDAVVAGAYDAASGNRGYVSVWEQDAQGVWGEVFREEGNNSELFLGGGGGVAGDEDDIVAASSKRILFFERGMDGSWSRDATPDIPASLTSNPVLEDQRVAIFSRQSLKIYERSAGTWAPVATLDHSSATPSSYQNRIPLDFDGDTVALGAWRHSLTSEGLREGAVFVWVDDDSSCDVNPCSGGAVCKDDVFRARCTCSGGYVDDPSSSTSCLDVNECVEETAGCSADATCTNTIGAFMCACDPGYVGDGLDCADVDECTLADTCDANATCTNELGSFTCACAPGFTGDGATCDDVDECAIGSAGCSADATCTNTIGAFMCACDPGYVGDGFACADVDECAEGSSNCDADATCTNAPGSFTCSCNPGYAGDGTTCADVDECSEGSAVCAAGEVCTNTNGGFACTELPPEPEPEPEPEPAQAEPTESSDGCSVQGTTPGAPGAGWVTVLAGVAIAALRRRRRLS
ncbi:MAG: EGF domain-containing protein, partial [Myxococcota bacterium]